MDKKRILNQDDDDDDDLLFNETFKGQEKSSTGTKMKKTGPFMNK